MYGVTGGRQSWLVGVLCAVYMLLAPATTYAQQLGGAIAQIAVQGNQRIEPATIRTYMAVREGDPFNPVTIDRSLKNLFATGLFADVSIIFSPSNIANVFRT